MESLSVAYGSDFVSYLEHFQEKQNYFFGPNWEANFVKAQDSLGEVELSNPYSRNQDIKKATKEPKQVEGSTLTRQKRILQGAVWGGAVVGSLLLMGGVYRGGVAGRWRKVVGLLVGSACLWGMRFGSRDQSRYLDLANSAVQSRVQGEAAESLSFADFVRYLTSKRMVVQGDPSVRHFEPPSRRGEGFRASCTYRFQQGCAYATWYGREANLWAARKFHVIDGEETRDLTAEDIGHYRLFERVPFGVCREQPSDNLGCHYLLVLLGEAVTKGDAYYRSRKAELNEALEKETGRFGWVRNRSAYKEKATTCDLKRVELDRSYREFQCFVEAAYGELRQRGGHQVSVLTEF